MLRDIHETNMFLKVFSTGGVTKTNKVGFLPGYGWVWYDLQGITNIISLARVTRKYRVTFDSEDGNVFHLNVKTIRSGTSRCWIADCIFPIYGAITGWY